jgi:hypothetical protein
MAAAPTSCALCHFWEPESAGDRHQAADTDLGTCHRVPPIPNAQTSEAAVWPLTQAADWCGEFAPAALPPEVVDQPVIMTGGTFVSSAVPGDVLSCTMGNWIGEPTTYDFAWNSDGTEVGTGDSYTVAASDAGHTIDCLVTASNSNGSTSVTSTAVTIA